MDKSGIDLRGRIFVSNNRKEKRDVKSRTMNRFTVLDEDIGSKYDYDDDETSIGVNYETSRARLEKKLQLRKDNQQLRTQTKGSGNTREFIYLITVKNCSKFGKDHILKVIANSLDDFYPVAPRINQSNVEFYLTQSSDAETIKSMSRRITDKKAGRLVIYVNRMPSPWDTLRPSVKILIESVVKQRYSDVSKSLDLSDFANDKEFLTAGVHCALFNNGIVVYVCNIISRHFSSINGLSLKGNRLRSLDYISSMVFCAPNITELDLSSNALTRIDELDRIRGWKVEKLHLENNECITRINAEDLTGTIHEYFPRVNYLNGVYVTQNPFKIVAETSEDGFILPYKLGFSPDENVRTHIEQFLIEYLNLYDSQDPENTRKGLINAYDESATFTFAVHRLRDAFSNTKYNTYVPKGDDEAFNTYIRSSHNIIHQSKWTNYREKILYKGSMDIAVALSKLPLTSHIKESFILDFNLITNDFIVFTLQGLLRDGINAFKPSGDCKFFVRNFVVVPKPENKIAIVSDMLSLTGINPDRMERYVNLVKKGANSNLMPSSSTSINIDKTSQMLNNISKITDNEMVSIAPPSTPQPTNLCNYFAQTTTTNPTTNSTTSYDINDPLIQQAMIQQFSDISKMKPEWSEKCLRDSLWNFEAAGNVFNDLHSKNQIPPEAFVTNLFC